ncbi:hypothetical protein OUZ56_011808 [Daphnia magna]|uniref:Uncharacterized protein n=1 Tax=Daphnia magna TaxID=35525 RepID=A0ABQ9Z1C3_9CRUS|nr:hypothetical protein OUZ56_011808 [Daphnia magna]
MAQDGIDLVFEKPHSNIFPTMDQSHMIPDYDRRTEPNPIPVYHGNIDVVSGLLQLRVSFRWRSLVDEDVIQMFRKLGSQNEAARPRVIFLSMAAWHMLETRDAFQIYGNKLRELSPILGHLAKASKVIWLNQYPTIDFYGETGAHNTKIFSEKIYRYNEGARGILRWVY